MAQYKVQAPDGHVVTLEGPDGASDQEVMAQAQKLYQPPQQAAPQAPAAQGQPVAAQGLAPPESADAPTNAIPEDQRPTSQPLGFVDALAGATNKLQGLDPVRALAGLIDPATAHGLDTQTNIGRQALNNAKLRQKPGAIGQFAGGMLASAPAMALGPIGGGLATGAILSDKTDPAGIAGDAALGGIGGKLGDTVLRGAGAVLAPKVQPAVKALLDRGVRLTPGQLMGGMAKSAEDKLTSVPFLGDMIQTARAHGLKDWNRSIFNDVLAPIGQTLPKTVQAGNEAFDHVYKTLGDAYDKVIPKTTTELDNDFVTHLQTAVAPIVQTLTPDGQAQFANILKQRVLSRFSDGKTPGNVVKEVSSELGTLASNFSSAADGNQRLLGQAITQVQQGLKDATERQNPLFAPVLKKIDQSYSMLASLRPAAGSTAAEHGVFTPKQLQVASKAADKSVGKNTTARGAARFQQAAQLAQDILPSKVPDSGTAGRSMMGAAATLLAGGAGAAAHIANPGLLAGGGLAMLPYTKIGQQVLKGVFSPGPVRQAGRGALDFLAHPGSSIAALLAAQGGQQ